MSFELVTIIDLRRGALVGVPGLLRHNRAVLCDLDFHNLEPSGKDRLRVVRARRLAGQGAVTTLLVFGARIYARSHHPGSMRSHFSCWMCASQ